MLATREMLDEPLLSPTADVSDLLSRFRLAPGELPLRIPPLHRSFDLKYPLIVEGARLPTRVRIEPPLDISLYFGLQYPDAIFNNERLTQFVHTARRVIAVLASDEKLRALVLRGGTKFVERDGEGRPIAATQDYDTPEARDTLLRSARAIENIERLGIPNLDEAALITHFVTEYLPGILENLRIISRSST